MLPDLHTGFSRGRSGGLVFPSLEEFSVYCDPQVKGFGIVNKAEIDVFLELSSFFNDPTAVGNLISGSSAFSKTSLNIWKFMVHILPRPRFNSWVRKILWRRDRLPTPVFLGFPGGSAGKEPACNAGDLSLIPGSSAFSKTSLNIWKFMVHI